jgi:undecaprenyl diphosphate synthase
MGKIVQFWQMICLFLIGYQASERKKYHSMRRACKPNFDVSAKNLANGAKNSINAAMKLLPTHVALIMDGNGRWAKERGLPRNEGHRRGATVARKISQLARKIGIKYATFFAFSSENFSRPAAEVSFLMNLFERLIKKYGKSFIGDGTRFRAIGDLDRLPKSLQLVLAQLERNTSHFDAFHLTMAIGYGARWEILRAVQSIVSEGQRDSAAIDWDYLKRHLCTADLPDPDLVIRTSGERRLSNFLLLQSAYAELFFTKTYWPNFGEKEFLTAIEDYGHRERRIGNVDGKSNS